MSNPCIEAVLGVAGTLIQPLGFSKVKAILISEVEACVQSLPCVNYKQIDREIIFLS